MLSIFSCAYWSSIYLLCRNVYSSLLEFSKEIINRIWEIDRCKRRLLIRIGSCSFFVAPWSLLAASEWSWTSLSRPLAARSSLKWMMNENFVTSTRSVWPQKLLALTLWVKNGRVIWSESAGMISRVSPWSRVSWPMAEFACYWVRGIPVTDQGELERESANLYGVALRMPIWVFSIWSSWNRGGYSWIHWYYSASSPWS